MCVCLQNRLDSKAPFYRTFIQLVPTQVRVSNSSQLLPRRKMEIELSNSKPLVQGLCPLPGLSSGMPCFILSILDLPRAGDPTVGN